MYNLPTVSAELVLCKSYKQHTQRHAHFQRTPVDIPSLTRMSTPRQSKKRDGIQHSLLLTLILAADYKLPEQQRGHLATGVCGGVCVVVMAQESHW